MMILYQRKRRVEQGWHGEQQDDEEMAATARRGLWYPGFVGMDVVMDRNGIVWWLTGMVERQPPRERERESE
eukprot:scaffold38007_cov168-Amphora_coffeaeformis.AAC.1